VEISKIVFGFFGGLAIFLFGMNLMSEGLKKMGNQAFKRILNSLTKNRAMAIVVGLGITCLIQSSSATSVMVVGLVNAALLDLGQAIAVVLGADIGTTITAWLVSVVGKFKIVHHALPVIGIGFLINFISKNRKRRMLGQAILGFGLLFLGLGTMADGVEPIKKSEIVKEFFANYGSNPLLGLFAGTMMTVVIQSSSATIAIIQIVALQGIFGLEAALPLMMGADIGTTITAQLAALGGTKGARGVAMANSFFKLLGVCIFLPLLLTGLFQGAVEAVIPTELDPRTGANSTIMVQIAAAHSVYIAFNVILFSTVLWSVLFRLSKWASGLKEDELSKRDTIYLDPLLLENPPIALEQCITQLTYMTRQAYKNITKSFEAFLDRNLEEVKKIEEREERIDELQEEITSYLVKLSSRELAHATSRAIPRIIHCINDAERIGDHAENLTELTELAINNKRTFSLEAKRELLNYFGLVDRQFKAVLNALEQRKKSFVVEAEELEDQINKQQEEMIQHHIARLEEGTCTVQAGLVFLDAVANLEKIGDHLVNIAERLDVT